MSEAGTGTAADELSRALIAEVDPSDQLGAVLALPEQLRDALWRVESAIMQDWDTSAGLVVAGMGGSAIGGALARAALGDHASRPIFVTRAYGLPSWTTPDTMVLCASYSGETEETLACYESAGALGARRTVVCTGGRLAEMARADGVPVIPLPAGFQPRAAVAYMIVAALEVAALCGAGPRLTSEIDVAASITSSRRSRPECESLVSSLVHGALESPESPESGHTWPRPSNLADLVAASSQCGPHAPGDGHIGNRSSAVDGDETPRRHPEHSTSQYRNKNSSNGQPRRSRPA